MTTAQIEEVFLTEVCTECGGEGVVEMGEYDNIMLVDCICRREEKAQRKADSMEDSEI